MLLFFYRIFNACFHVDLVNHFVKNTLEPIADIRCVPFVDRSQRYG